MALKHITFTGIDAKTDIDELLQIQKEYPLAEWGVLLCSNWADNGNRFPHPGLLNKFADEDLFLKLNLSCHICGRAARKAAAGDWRDVIELTGCRPDIFRRCQLNVADDKTMNPSFLFRPDVFDELIVQQKSRDEKFLLSLVSHSGISILMDASGGRGIDMPIEVWSSETWPMAFVDVGYAGGINEDNVVKKLEILKDIPEYKDWWIDMETGVRTDDWFDTAKVRRILSLVYDALKL